MSDYSGQITQLNPVDIPAMETDFYAWLDEHRSGQRSADLTAYLESKGFVIGEDRLSAECLNTLRAINDFFHFCKSRKWYKIP